MSGFEEDIREASDMGFEHAREGWPSREREFPVQFRKYYRAAYRLIKEMRENEPTRQACDDSSR